MTWKRIPLWSVVVALQCVGTWVIADEPPIRATVVRPAGSASDDVIELTLINDLDDQLRAQRAEAESQAKYWIGLICGIPSDSLRAQLGLEQGTGLLVEQLQDDAPAQKAGIQQHDLLVTATITGKDPAEAKPLKAISDLVETVQAAETTAIKLELFRRGQKQVIEVVPAERPVPRAASIDVHDPATGVRLRWAGPMVMNAQLMPPLPPGMTIEFQPKEGTPEKVVVKVGEKVHEATIGELDKLPPDIAMLVRHHLAFRTGIHSRAALAYASSLPDRHLMIVSGGPVLPEDVSVTIVRKGAAAPKITLSRGEQSWDVSEKSMNDIPKDLRVYAESALRGRPDWSPAPLIRALPAPPAPAPPRVVRRIEERPGPAAYKHQLDLERQVKDLAEQVERLREAIEKSKPAAQ